MLARFNLNRSKKSGMGFVAELNRAGRYEMTSVYILDRP